MRRCRSVSAPWAESPDHFKIRGYAFCMSLRCTRGSGHRSLRNGSTASYCFAAASHLQVTRYALWGLAVNAMLCASSGLQCRLCPSRSAFPEGSRAPRTPNGRRMTSSALLLEMTATTRSSFQNLAMAKEAKEVHLPSQATSSATTSSTTSTSNIIETATTSHT